MDNYICNVYNIYHRCCTACSHWRQEIQGVIQYVPRWDRVCLPSSSRDDFEFLTHCYLINSRRHHLATFTVTQKNLICHEPLLKLTAPISPLGDKLRRIGLYRVRLYRSVLCEYYGSLSKGWRPIPVLPLFQCNFVHGCISRAAEEMPPS